MLRKLHFFRWLFRAQLLLAPVPGAFSKIQRFSGGVPHFRWMFLKLTHFPSGARYPGPPLQPHPLHGGRSGQFRAADACGIPAIAKTINRPRSVLAIALHRSGKKRGAAFSAPHQLENSSRRSYQQRLLPDHSVIDATMPAPTVRPPSRIAKRSFSSMAIGTISSTSTVTLSPGITISVPSGSETTPVTSVVRK